MEIYLNKINVSLNIFKLIFNNINNVIIRKNL